MHTYAHVYSWYIPEAVSFNVYVYTYRHNYNYYNYIYIYIYIYIHRYILSIPPGGKTEAGLGGTELGEHQQLDATWNNGVWKKRSDFPTESGCHQPLPSSLQSKLSNQTLTFGEFGMLIGGLEHFLFSHILGIMIPINIFQMG